MEHKLLGASKIPVVPAVPVNPVLAKAIGPLGLPSISVVPEVVPVPATPAANLSKKQKLRVRSQKAICKIQRATLRKSVLSILLGRQVAGPTVGVLKLIPKGGSWAVGASTSAAPVPVPMPI